MYTHVRLFCVYVHVDVCVCACMYCAGMCGNYSVQKGVGGDVCSTHESSIMYVRETPVW